MTIEQRITAALSPLGDPVAHDVYTLKADRYYVFMYKSQGDNYADDVPDCERYNVSIHFYAPLKWTEMSKRRKETKQALFDAGFGLPEIWTEIEDDKRHMIFTCEYIDETEIDTHG